MFRIQYVIRAILSAGLVILGTEASAHTLCRYTLTPVSTTPSTATAKVKIRDNNEVRIKFRDALPDTLYTVWIDFRSRASGALADDYQRLIDEGKDPLPRGVAPAFVTTTGVTEGMGLDANAVITDEDGDADFRKQLDYNILETAASPVVGIELSMQGMNRVGGSWLRIYTDDPNVGASLQITDPATRLPRLERATAQGITIVRHPDFITHGHTPGVGDVDNFSAFKGDFPVDCVP